MSKLFALLNVFRRGGEVMDAEAWKKGTINVNLVTAALAAVVAAAQAFGYDHLLTTEQIALLGTVLVSGVALANSLLTAATSTRAGIPGLAPAPVVEPVVPAPAPVPAPLPNVAVAGGGGVPAREDVPPVQPAPVGYRSQPQYDPLADPFGDHGA